MFRSSPIPKRAFRAFRRLLRDRRGAAAVILAITLPWIIGFASLGSEVAAWYFTTRAMQGAVDAAAESAAAELAAATVSGSLTTSITDQLSHTGRAIAATFNFSNGVSNTTVAVNRLTTTGTGLDATKCDSRMTAGGTSPYGCYVEV